MHNKTKLISIIFSFFFFLFSFFLPVFTASAIDIKLKPQVTIDSQFKQGSEIDVPTDMSLMISLIKTFYKYSIGVVGILAAIALMIAGLLWLTAGGNSSQLGTAKEIIKGSFLGLVLVMLSFSILATVNPSLVNFENVKIKPLTKKGIDISMPDINKSVQIYQSTVAEAEKKIAKIEETSKPEMEKAIDLGEQDVIKRKATESTAKDIVQIAAKKIKDQNSLSFMASNWTRYWEFFGEAAINSGAYIFNTKLHEDYSPWANTMKQNIFDETIKIINQQVKLTDTQKKELIKTAKPMIIGTVRLKEVGN